MYRPKAKNKVVALTVWIEETLKTDLNELAQRRGDVTRMVERGIKREIAAIKAERQQTEPTEITDVREIVTR